MRLRHAIVVAVVMLIADAWMFRTHWFNTPRLKGVGCYVRGYGSWGVVAARQDGDYWIGCHTGAPYAWAIVYDPKAKDIRFQKGTGR